MTDPKNEQHNAPQTDSQVEPPADGTSVDPADTPAGAGDPVKEPRATTAGEQSHSDPTKYRGDKADAPADTGKPAQDNN